MSIPELCQETEAREKQETEDFRDVLGCRPCPIKPKGGTGKLGESEASISYKNNSSNKEGNKNSLEIQSA